MAESGDKYRSVIFGIMNSSYYQKGLYYISFFLAPFHPIIALFTRPEIKGWRGKTFNIIIVVLLSLYVAILLLSFFIGDYIVPLFPENIKQMFAIHPVLAKVIIILSALVINILLYPIYLMLDFHNIIADAFESNTKERLNKCFEEILGHKLWSGSKTYKFLEYLLQQNVNLGRAKWLLVNFLRDGIENSIHKSEVNIRTGINEETQVLPQYKIEGNKWDVYDYSLFLKNNLSHAEKSVHWLVDPEDFLFELIPSYLTEVIVSIGMWQSPNSWMLLKPLLKESGLPSYCIHEVLKDIKLDYNMCPWNINGKCDHIKLEDKRCNKNVCAAFGLKWKRETDSQISIRNCFYAIFYGLGLNTLTRVIKTTSKTLYIDSKNINFDCIYKEYEKREDVIEDYSLPHIFGFRNLLVEHKRNIYLGIQGDILEDLVEKELGGTSSEGYCQMIYPRIKLKAGDPPLIEQNGCFITGEADDSVNYKYKELWQAVKNKDVFDIILRWSYRLFEYSSGGEKVVSGLMVKQKPEREIFDLGVYDSSLLIESEPIDPKVSRIRKVDPKVSRIRKIDWVLYNNYSTDISDIMNTYFPPKDNLLSSNEVQNKLINAFTVNS